MEEVICIDAYVMRLELFLLSSKDRSFEGCGCSNGFLYALLPESADYNFVRESKERISDSGDSPEIVVSHHRSCNCRWFSTPEKVVS